eukprot:scaffold8589_cov18-Tisochrysis_lutea.AAC.2
MEASHTLEWEDGVEGDRGFWGQRRKAKQCPSSDLHTLLAHHSRDELTRISATLPGWCEMNSVRVKKWRPFFGAWTHTLLRHACGALCSNLQCRACL